LPPSRTTIFEKAEAGVEPLVEMIVARMTESSDSRDERISARMSNAGVIRFISKIPRGQMILM
jgi:hypothetical protein